jgi:hypothetical protein
LRTSFRHTLWACAACVVSASAWGRGASPYLPLNLSPEIERQIERVLILADKPVMTRPIPAAVVLDALPAACKVDEVLCNRVRTYLQRYTKKVSLDHAAFGLVQTDGAETPLPNQRGQSSDSSYTASLHAYAQPNDYTVLSLGAVAYDGEILPTGSMLSVGFDFAQLDIGYRDHWLSPFTGSSMLISTQAQTLPSITLSNYRPLTRFGFQYEVFLAELSNSDRISFRGMPTSGKPRVAGLHLGIEPAAGWSLSANRLLQFGGGARGGRGVSDFFDALFKPRQNDNSNDASTLDSEFGNQLASITSSFVFPGPMPFAAYLEYAGEDTSFKGNYRLGNAALSIGVHFPQLWQALDLTVEVSEWQNSWYVNGIYGDGLTNKGNVLGHFGADRRLFNDGVGAQSQLVRVGWEPGFGGVFEFNARSLRNESYAQFPYERAYDFGASYSRALRGYSVGAEFLVGKDVFGESFSRIGGYMRFTDEWGAGGISRRAFSPIARPRGAELFVSAGLNANRANIRFDDGGREITTSMEIAPHLGIGARRAVSDRSDLGVRLEVDRINDDLLLAVRALDYRYRFRNPLSLGLFVGAARYEQGIPAYGYYLGGGVQWRNLLPGLDLELDVRYADKVARDKLLPGDPPTAPRPDIFIDIESAALSLSYKF